MSVNIKNNINIANKEIFLLCIRVNYLFKIYEYINFILLLSFIISKIVCRTNMKIFFFKNYQLYL
jgi:hypothetical protein